MLQSQKNSQVLSSCIGVIEKMTKDPEMSGLLSEVRECMAGYLLLGKSSRSSVVEGRFLLRYERFEPHYLNLPTTLRQQPMII